METFLIQTQLFFWWLGGLFLLLMNLKHTSPVQTCFVDSRLVYSANCLISISAWTSNQHHKLNMSKTKLSVFSTYTPQANTSLLHFPHLSNLLILESFLTPHLFSAPPSPFLIHQLIQNEFTSFTSSAFILQNSPRCHFLSLNYYSSFLASLFAATLSPYFQLSRLSGSFGT